MLRFVSFPFCFALSVCLSACLFCSIGRVFLCFSLPSFVSFSGFVVVVVVAAAAAAAVALVVVIVVILRMVVVLLFYFGFIYSFVHCLLPLFSSASSSSSS